MGVIGSQTMKMQKERGSGLAATETEREFELLEPWDLSYEASCIQAYTFES
jgi:hypothetical protein